MPVFFGWNRLRNRLMLLFLAATIPPLAATLWVAASLLQRSLSYSSTRELDQISRSLEKTGRQYYQQSREALHRDATEGRLAPVRYAAGDRARWPAEIREFWESGQPERYVVSGKQGDRLDYVARRGGEVWVWSRSLGAVGMETLSRQYREARAAVEAARERNLPRGFITSLLLIALGIWVVSLGLLLYFAARTTRPIQDLTAGLTRLASGDLGARVATDREDEVGRAIRAFNEMGVQLEQSRSRLVYLAQLASWQSLARKMAHEIKNSLTPIRLTMEEIQARTGNGDREFLGQATQIVVEEVDSLERRVRAFSEFAAEPPVRPAALDVNALIEERVAFLKNGRPDIVYELRLSDGLPAAHADHDLVKGILTNLLENAAEAAGPGGRVLGTTLVADGKVAIEVHDSGPGLSAEARRSLFEPAISFKKGGMGLGLSIARKSALLSGGDVMLVKGELGGAGFRVLLPIHAG